MAETSQCRELKSIELAFKEARSKLLLKFSNVMIEIIKFISKKLCFSSRNYSQTSSEEEKL